MHHSPEDDEDDEEQMPPDRPLLDQDVCDLRPEDMQSMRVDFIPKGKSHFPEQRPGRGRIGSAGAFLPPEPCTSSVTMEKQFPTELDISSPMQSPSKKIPSMVSEKRGGRSRHHRRAARRKATPQERSPPGANVSKIVLGRHSQSYLLGGTIPTFVFPPISGLPTLGVSVKYPRAHSRTKQRKHRSSGSKSVQRLREPELQALEDISPSQEATRPGPSSLPHRGHSRGHNYPDHKIKSCQVGGDSQAPLRTQERTQSKDLTPCGDQEPIDPSQQEKKQLSQASPRCPRCSVLQKEVDDLQNQLVSMLMLSDKFQLLHIKWHRFVRHLQSPEPDPAPEGESQ